MKKALTGVTIKDAALGTVEAVFSTFDVVDHDGDLTRKGAFTEGAPVVISAYGHKSHDGVLPVGKGTIHEDGDRAILKGQFFLNTTQGRDTFETVKALSEDGLQEWSYSLQNVESERATIDGKSVRIITKVGLVKEVSPVLIGAGIATETLSVKATKQAASSLSALLRQAGRDRWPDAWVWIEDYDPDESWVVFAVETSTDGPRLLQVAFTATDTSATLAEAETPVHPTTTFLPKGNKFAERTTTALRGMKALAEMAVERLTLRAAQGKSIDEQIEAYEAALAALAPLKAAIDEHTASTTPPPADDALATEFVRFVALSQGVTP